MKQLTNKIKHIISSDKGETLIETVVSMIIFVVSMLTISSMVNTALKITESTTQKATLFQEKTINPAVLSNFDESEQANITFYNDQLDISATHAAIINKNGEIPAFTPKGANEP